MSPRFTVGPVFHIAGMLLAILGIGMLIPALVDAADHHPDWLAFVGGFACTLAVAGGLYLSTGGAQFERFTLKHTFLLTSLAWVILALFGALPLMFSSLRLSFTDAYYEAMSGLSTTGATVIVGLDHAPAGVLLWRALLNWLGGVGIIVMAIAILPVLRVGGMQLFRSESSDRSDKVFSTVRDTAGAIGVTYVVLSLISALLFHLAGMNWFDAICHAMGAVSTGGFSTKDTSLGWYDSHAVLWAATVSMIFGALPLTYYIRLLRNFRATLLSDSQVITLVAILAFAIASMTLWAWKMVGLPFWDSLSHSAMNVTSIITDCGFVSIDYSAWGGYAVAAFFVFYFIGGCTGSTSGSVKVFRWQILVQSIATQMKQMVRPHQVVLLLYHGKVVEQDVIDSVINFVTAYILVFAALTMVLAALGLDFLTASSAIAAALAGAGPGLGPVIGPAGNYQSLPDAAKWVLSAAMLLGRLEIFTVFVLFTRAFWKE